MIDPTARETWENLEATLRPFIARRVPAAADVDDVIQDVFLRLQRGLPQLRDGSRFGPWVYQVLRSAIAEHRRQAGRHPVAEAATSEEVLPFPAENDDEKPLASYLALFLSALPPSYREALALTELQGLTHGAAARAAGVSLTCMKSRVRRGQERLRDVLATCCKVALDSRGHVLDYAPKSNTLLPDCRCN